MSRMQEGRVSVFMGVPTMYSLLLKAFDSWGPEEQVGLWDGTLIVFVLKAFDSWGPWEQVGLKGWDSFINPKSLWWHGAQSLSLKRW